MTCLFCGDSESECQCPVVTLFDPGMFGETYYVVEMVASGQACDESMPSI